MNVNEIKQRVIRGINVTRSDAEILASASLDELCAAAREITERYHGRKLDSCSIINARSGLCSEDCKWCAQASRHNTGCRTYDFIDPQHALDAAIRNKQAGIKRFSIVTSGKKVTGKDLDRFCDLIRQIHSATGLYICASMGLLGKDEMLKLKEAGVKRYHCNMESSSEHFRTLCTTHTPADKISTLEAAKEAGLEICSGGIIGMGETLSQRIEFAFELRRVDPVSVPINILIPIPGTPLENIPLIGEEEIIRSVALFRFILPDKALRFAGGRLRVSREAQMKILQGGINGALMGDMLTTVSNLIEDDKQMFREAGLEF